MCDPWGISFQRITRACLVSPTSGKKVLSVVVVDMYAEIALCFPTRSLYKFASWLYSYLSWSYVLPPVNINYQCNYWDVSFVSTHCRKRLHKSRLWYCLRYLMFCIRFYRYFGINNYVKKNMCRNKRLYCCYDLFRCPPSSYDWYPVRSCCFV